ncbi:MAG: hypothetical protein AAFN74_09895 [Myxococcota bacterium]
MTGRDFGGIRVDKARRLHVVAVCRIVVSMKVYLLPLILLGLAACVDAGDPLNEGALSDGLDDPPGSGLTYVVSSLQIRGAQETPIANCPTSVCGQNAWAPASDLLSDYLRQALFGGEFLVVFELAGLVEGGRRNGPATLKAYEAVDFDVPFFPANNFTVPPGQQDCCQFSPQPTSLVSSPPQARYRAPVMLTQGRLSTTAPLSTGLWFATIRDFEINGFIPIEQVWMTAQLTEDAMLMQGQIAGAISVAALQTLESPLFCRPSICPADWSLAEAVEAFFGAPDICDAERGCWAYSVSFDFSAQRAELLLERASS